MWWLSSTSLIVDVQEAESKMLHKFTYLPWVFPNLIELIVDHCMDLIQLPKSICWLQSLKSLSVTSCHNLVEPPTDLGLGLLDSELFIWCLNIQEVSSSHTTSLSSSKEAMDLGRLRKWEHSHEPYA